MADRELGRNSRRRGTSEATPPREDDSPEVVNQPSPPEEERISSSTDEQPLHIRDAPVDLTLSQTYVTGSSDGAGPSTGRRAVLRLSMQSGQQDEPLNLESRDYVEARAILPTRENPVLVIQIDPELVRAAFETPSVQAALEVAKSQAAEGGGQVVDSPPKPGKAKESIDEKSDDSNQQFDVEELSSSASKSSPENIDFGSDSSPTGSGEEPRGSESNVTDIAGVVSELSPRTDAVTEEEGSPGIGETVASESELSSPRTGATTPGSQGIGAIETVASESELSSPRTGANTPGSQGIGAIETVASESELSSPRTGTATPGSTGIGAIETVGSQGELSSPKTGAATPGNPGIGAIETVASESELSSPKTGAAPPGSQGIGATQTVGSEGELSSPKTGSNTSGSGISVIKYVGWETFLSPPKTTSSGTGAKENIEFKIESPSKTGTSVPGTSSRERAEIETQSSPLKRSTLGVEGSHSIYGTPEKKRGFVVSPKRKSPAKVQHLPPKRSAPFAARRQSDSQMSTLLQECLAIAGEGDCPGTSGPISGDEQGRGAEAESDDPQNEGSDMEVQEAEVHTEREDSEGYSTDDNTVMKDSD